MIVAADIRVFFFARSGSIVARVARSARACYFLSAAITAWRELSIGPVTRQLERERRENRSFRCNEP